jgi:hypothetical protein
MKTPLSLPVLVKLDICAGIGRLGNYLPTLCRPKSICICFESSDPYVEVLTQKVASPTGGLVVIGLSASRLARMPAAFPESKYLFHIVSEYKPYLLRQGHFDMEVCQKSSGAGTAMIVLVIVIMHDYSLSPMRGNTLSILK